MNEIWLYAFLTSVFLTPLALYVGYFFVVPHVMIEGYRRGLPAGAFSSVDGSEGAGSIDIEYYTLYFDVRNQDIVISGLAPDARHWQIGAFDGMARLVDGAYLNQRTIKLDDEGRFHVRLTTHPNSIDGDDVLDCSLASRGMVIFRVVLPREPVEVPNVATHKAQPHTALLDQTNI